jgi:amphi-Trp domain-containing protein
VALTPLIEFARRRALRVRIARGQPGASPSTQVPRGLWRTAVCLLRIAIGGSRAAASDPKKTREGISDERLRGRETRELTRDEAATRLRRIAGVGEEIEFGRGDMDFKVSIPEQVEWNVELELGDEENELELRVEVVSSGRPSDRVEV